MFAQLSGWHSGLRPRVVEVSESDPATVERIWAYQVRPYLAEHWFERPEELSALDRDVQALIAEQS